MTFSANHSHQEESAVKHRPAGDNRALHMYQVVCARNVPALYSQARLWLYCPVQIPFISACSSGKTTCRKDDKTTREFEWNTNKQLVWTVMFCQRRTRLWDGNVGFIYFHIRVCAVVQPVHQRAMLPARKHF